MNKATAFYLLSEQIHSYPILFCLMKCNEYLSDLTFVFDSLAGMKINLKY